MGAPPEYEPGEPWKLRTIGAYDTALSRPPLCNLSVLSTGSLVPWWRIFVPWWRKLESSLVPWWHSPNRTPKRFLGHCHGGTILPCGEEPAPPRYAPPRYELTASFTLDSFVTDEG
jgi:hypothetical protein